MEEINEQFICPFCEKQCIPAKPGKTNCSSCSAQFEIDDRLESVFVDTDNIRLPLKGVVCSSCGLVQGDCKMCLYYGAEINTAVH